MEVSMFEANEVNVGSCGHDKMILPIEINFSLYVKC